MRFELPGVHTCKPKRELQVKCVRLAQNTLELRSLTS